ncbi:KR domain protein [Leptospira ellinghausenii]|uniref:KR domain protein n=1 Tax=Leptospira ellinghausenii TaxID=1917822 RepID=A0A2P2DCA5_9LEPT|nr:SDR family NAD(P)-dependent oxidoreductase [Leptospira ellinghausenii]GBF42237.1 KR domain protein [Leptospira ellinghausenii]
MNTYLKYNRLALVTGASSGIGKDFAYELAKNGFSLYLVARDVQKLKWIKTEFETNFGIQVTVFPKDLTKEEDVDDLLKVIDLNDFGLMVLAAGFGSGGKFDSLDIENEASMVDLNCKSVVKISHHFLKKNIKGERKGLILFGSLVGFQGVPWTATYAATKAFIQSFAEGLYWEYKKSGVDVISVAPGPVQSGFGDRAGMFMGNAQSPEGIAKIVLKKLGKTVTVRPGFLSKFLGYSLLSLPRNLRTFLMKQIMGKMVFGNK